MQAFVICCYLLENYLLLFVVICYLLLFVVICYLLLFVRKLFKYNKSDMKPLLILLQPPWWLTLNVSLWLMSPDAKSLFKLD